MPSKPAVKTYGRMRPTVSTSLLFDSTPFVLSSPPSTRLDTPPTSPSRQFRHDSPQSRHVSPQSPLFAEDDIGEVIVALPALKAGPTTQSTLKGFFTSEHKESKKRPLEERRTIPSTARPKSSAKGLQQMHLTHLPLLHSCKDCAMSYVRGGEDEHLHARHHAKVVRGIPWENTLGKGKGKGKASDGWRVVQDHVEFGTGREKGKGRIIVCEGSHGGGKLDEILSMVDTVLSSPPISPEILERCRIFLLVTSSPPPRAKRQKAVAKSKNAIERIVGVVVSQPIKTALRVLRDDEEGVKPIDSGGGVLCDPEPLPTPLGIHRLFTIPSYRSLGLAQMLLEAAARHTVYGCDFDPKKGEVAFSQPTESGRRAMERWGGGAVRVFIDDERQL